MPAIRPHEPERTCAADAWRLPWRTLLALLLGAAAAPAQSDAYRKDFEFLCTTIREQGASVKLRGIDWPKASKALEPLFLACRDDVTHVRNCMELIALLGDGHSGVRSHKVDDKALPGKFDGLYGAGLRLLWDRGRVLVAGMMSGHKLADQIAPGALLVGIDGLPAWLVVERELRRIKRYQGTSSDHSLFATLANRFLPFGERQSLPLVFRTSDGKRVAVEAQRWGPGGKAWSAFEHETPPGTQSAAGAVARMLDHPPIGQVGYLRITGKMDEATERAFHAAMDTLKDMKACVLDCRGMGGGGDQAAWAIAGRFFQRGFDNGQHGKVAASGSWQYDGPLVMLQDALEVSSAETLTWAMSETDRVLSIGQRTGGWAIIPKLFDCPSGLLQVRIGVNARTTPIRRVQTEGTGWPPDLALPAGPVLGADPGSALALALDVLQLEHAGVPRATLRKALHRLDQGDGKAFAAEVKPRVLRTPSSDVPDRLARAFAEDLEARLRGELALATAVELPVPDVAGMQARCAELAPKATAAGFATLLADWRRALTALAREEQAQRDLLRLLDQGFRPRDAKVLAEFRSKHGTTRTAKDVAGLLRE